MSKRKLPALAALVLAAAGLIAIMVRRPGFETDVGTFTAWAYRLAEVGVANFYTEGYFADYFPLYLYVLKVAGEIIQGLGLVGSKAVPYLIKTPASIALLALGIVVHRIFSRRDDKAFPWWPLVGAAAVLFNPALLYNVAVFGQVDALFVLLGVLAIDAALEGRAARAAVFCGLGLAFKPLAVVTFGCVIAIAWVRRTRWTRPATLGALAAFAGTLAITFVPFWVGRLDAMLPYYAAQTKTYPYVGVNAFNLYGALGWNWHRIDDVLVLGLTKGRIAQLLLPLGVLALLAYARIAKGLSLKTLDERQALLMCGAAAIVGYMLAPAMHERYFIVVFPMLILLMRDRRVAGALILASLALAVDQMAAVDANFGSKHAVGGFSPLFVVSAVVKVAAMRLLLKALGKDEDPVARPRPGVRSMSFAALEPWARRDAIIMIGLTLVSIPIGALRLGDRFMPHTSVGATAVRARFAADAEARRSFGVFINGGEGIVRLTCLGADEPPPADDPTAFKKLEGVRSWQIYPLPTPCSKDLLVDIRFDAAKPGSVSEVMAVDAHDRIADPLTVCDAEGATCEPARTSPLFDEPETVNLPIDFRNSTYFDEIYYVRTAHEMIEGKKLFEFTHPPFGKVVIAASILALGDHPYAWRLPIAIFGILIPALVYALARQASGRRRIAMIAAGLALLDTGRIAMARIATIDVTVLFFLLLAYLAIISYLRAATEKAPTSRLWGWAIVGGIGWGLAVATKWVAVYLAPLGLLGMGWLIARDPKAWRVHLVPLMTGFVALPVAVYGLTYIPPLLSGSIQGLAGIIENNAAMYGYHSGIVGLHPYSSNFYEWAWNQRPLLMFQGVHGFDSWRRVIVAIGNPLLWAGVPVAMYVAAGRAWRGTDVGTAVILGGTLVQLMPWMLVTRSTFAYHYMPTATLGAVLIAIFAAEWRGRWRLPLLLATASALFVAYWPLATGWPIADAWVQGVKAFDTWSF